MTKSTKPDPAKVMRATLMCGVAGCASCKFMSHDMDKWCNKHRSAPCRGTTFDKQICPDFVYLELDKSWILTGNVGENWTNKD